MKAKDFQNWLYNRGKDYSEKYSKHNATADIYKAAECRQILREFEKEFKLEPIER